MESKIGYFKNITTHSHFSELSEEVERAYHAAKDELSASLSSLLSKTDRLNYLREVETLSFAPTAFDDLIMQGGKSTFKDLLDISQGERTVSEEAKIRLQIEVLQNIEQDSETGQDVIKLTDVVKMRIALLQTVGTKAYHCWKSFHEEVDRQMRLNTFSMIHDIKSSRRKERTQNILFEDLWTNQKIASKVDSILISLKLIQKKSGKIINIQRENCSNPGRPFVAVFRLLEMVKVVRGTHCSIDDNLRVPNPIWSALFSNRYGVEMTEGTIKYKIDNKKLSVEFIEDVKRTVPFVEDAFPANKSGSSMIYTGLP